MSSATPTYGITRTSTSAGFTYAAKGNSANVPVTYVNWGDAVRLVNWLQNGEPTGPAGPGTTETGSYLLNGGTSQAALIAVARGSKANWILPTVNEWYKAAYYSGGGGDSPYWFYPTQSNLTPSNVLSATGTNNANYEAVIGNPPVATRSDPVGWLTPVGAFAESPGPYGTFDMGGDVAQWLQTPLEDSYYGVYGGSFAGDPASLASPGYGDATPTLSAEDLGFRVAYVPEPSTSELLAAAGMTCIFIFRRRRVVHHKGV